MFANQQITDLPLPFREKEWADDLRRVLARATQPDPSERYQSVDEFWQDLEPVRRIAYDIETATSVRPKLHETPQPHVSRGYSPLAPQQPRFDTSRELKLKHPFGPPAIAERGTGVIADRRMRDADFVSGSPVSPAISLGRSPAASGGDFVRQYPGRGEPVALPEADEAIRNPSSQIRNRRWRRLATFAILLLIFAGGLYGTSAFLRSRGIIPPISNPFTAKTGRANTDINLRPEPNANNEPIGLVTKNSRVRILKAQNNWYQVDVLEQGRDRDVQLATSRGWLNGKYVDLD